MDRKAKIKRTIAFVILAVSLLPWVFMLAAAVVTFFSGTTVGLFEAATKIYGAEAFLYTIEVLLLVFMPICVISAITALVSAIILIVQKKKENANAVKSSAKVIMTCGRICSGKSTYAKKLRDEYKAVILSVDEITLALFGQDAGEKHNEYVEKLEEYLFDKSVEIVKTGTNVVLDWGFWQKREREYARKFYSERSIACELHYLSISDEEWERRLQKRNEDVTAGRISAYYVDDGLKAKFAGMFEPPEENEADAVIKA